jgi:signal transduction histidine kinase
MKITQRNPGLAVPVIVALLMVLVSVTVSKLVLWRLADTQAEHFRQLTGAFLDGLSTASHRYVLRRDPWETFDVIDRAQTKYSGIESRLVLVVLPDDTVLAASDPLLHPIGSAAPQESRASATEPRLDSEGGYVWVHRSLSEGGVEIGRIAARIDVTRFQAVQRQALVTLISFNVVLTFIFVGLGSLLVRRIMKPLIRLSDYLARSADGRLEPIRLSDIPPADTDVGRAYRRYNAAAAAIAEREELIRKLAEEERRALIGRYASAMAHEVNNPLGGMLNAVRMIERHGDNAALRLAAARLLERGLTGIHNVVRASLVTWRGEADPRPLEPADIEDIRYLIHSEASRRDLRLAWFVEDAAFEVPAQAVRQIALNLLLNACAASPPGTTVDFSLTIDGEDLVLRVEDRGPGMPREMRLTLVAADDKAGASYGGLGLWTVARLAQSLRGSISLSGPPGTCVIVRIPNAVRRQVQAVA